MENIKVNPVMNKNFHYTTTAFKGGVGKIKKIIMQPDAYVSTYYKTHGHIDIKDCLSKLFLKLKQIGEKENFNVILQSNSHNLLDNFSQINNNENIKTKMSCWAQDNGIYILDREFKPLILENGLIRKSEEGLLNSRAEQLGIKYKKINSRVDGGNAYFGIKEDGSRYLLVGKNAVIDTGLKLALAESGINLKNILEASNGTVEFSYKNKTYQTSLKAMMNNNMDSTIPTEIQNKVRLTVNKLSENNLSLQNKAIREIAKDFELEEKQVKVVSSPEFHIDMFMRPIDEKTILVYDPELTKKILETEKEKVSDDKRNVIQSLINQITEFEYQRIQEKNYAPMNKIIDELKQYDYENIIKVPGIFTNGSTNFLNALVHKNNEGEYIYITNTGSKKQDVIDFNKLFEDEIRKKCPQIKSFYFLGDIEDPVISKNLYMPDNEKYFINDLLLLKNGGIHCCSFEICDFKKQK